MGTFLWLRKLMVGLGLLSFPEAWGLDRNFERTRWGKATWN